MQWKIRLTLIFGVSLLFGACNSAKPTLVFEELPSASYTPGIAYTNDLRSWKKYYESCFKTNLFANAFYLGLQDRVYIGSINSSHKTDVSKGINVLDTSRGKNIFNLMYIIQSQRCGETMELTQQLRSDFFKEVDSALATDARYAKLLSLADTGAMSIIPGSMYNNSFIEERLSSTLDSTKDPLLLRYKTLVVQPGNAMLAETVELMGFQAEMGLKRKLSPAEQERWNGQATIDNDFSKIIGKVAISADGYVTIQVNKRYTIFGKFVQVKDGSK